MQWVLAAVVMLLFAVPAQAQRSNAEKFLAGPYEEWIDGAAGNAVLRGPWMSPTWRKPLPRAVIWTTLSVVYEIAFDRSHGGKWDGHATRDFLEREAGFLLAEAMVALGKKVF